jgi:DNA gyrase subunit B
MPDNSYDTQHIQVISSIEGVRKRPGMYFGSTDASGMELFVYELVSNVLDAYLAGTATFVSVDLDGNTITVVDDGQGLPFDLPSDIDGISLATKSLTTLHFTGTEDGHAPHVHVQYASGMGLAVLNAASSTMKIQSWRDGVRWEQRFCQGIALDVPSIVEYGDRCGTRIEVTPDPEIFKGAKLRSSTIEWHLFETAHLVKGIEIRFGRERFYAPEGLVQLLPFIDLDRSSLTATRLPFHKTLKVEGVLIDAVASGQLSSNQPKIYSWVNGGMSELGGSHVDGFLAALDELAWNPAVVLIHVVMFDPAFAEPTQAKLDVPSIMELVRSTLIEPLQQYLIEVFKKIDSDGSLIFREGSQIAMKGRYKCHLESLINAKSCVGEN